jgi:hypothetical protein
VLYHWTTSSAYNNYFYILNSITLIVGRHDFLIENYSKYNPGINVTRKINANWKKIIPVDKLSYWTFKLNELYDFLQAVIDCPLKSGFAWQFTFIPNR